MYTHRYLLPRIYCSVVQLLTVIGIRKEYDELVKRRNELKLKQSSSTNGNIETSQIIHNNITNSKNLNCDLSKIDSNLLNFNKNNEQEMNDPFNTCKFYSRYRTNRDLSTFYY